MPSCVMRFCTNYTNKVSKSQGITFHSFPLNELRRIRWVDIVRQQRKEESWQPNSSSKICSNHFKDEDKYTSCNGFILLKKSAFPVLEATEDSQSTPASPSSLADENVSDLESILDTPHTAALKNCVRKLTLEKQKLINKNRNLKKQNRRLQKKIANLSAILNQVKEKRIL
ncbi:unnamed protein product [Parnassius apollo]|uniref:(apollo) hypothetical protein n=1 Tax=Parnassius apollo TaxID=110799 RepID=A0A8S3X199_PARAO|nr:unnamed protein product [Parnassius apollo]